LKNISDLNHFYSLQAGRHTNQQTQASLTDNKFCNQ